MDDPIILRRRAMNLRRLASSLETSILHTLYIWFGPTTWVGPGPTQCLEQAKARSRQLTDSASALRRRARALDDRADAAALRTTLPTAE
jgi:hypothetical protein